MKTFHMKKMYKKVTAFILAITMIIAGIYILVNSGAILQTVGVAIVVYGIVDIIENIIFIKRWTDIVLIARKIIYLQQLQFN